MDTLICMEGDALEAFLGVMATAARAQDGYAPYRLRVAVDGGQLKVKVNEYTWTAPLGAVTTGEAAQ